MISRWHWRSLFIVGVLFDVLSTTTTVVALNGDLYVADEPQFVYTEQRRTDLWDHATSLIPCDYSTPRLHCFHNAQPRNHMVMIGTDEVVIHDHASQTLFLLKQQRVNNFRAGYANVTTVKQVILVDGDTSHHGDMIPYHDEQSGEVVVLASSTAMSSSMSMHLYAIRFNSSRGWMNVSSPLSVQTTTTGSSSIALSARHRFVFTVTSVGCGTNSLNSHIYRWTIDRARHSFFSGVPWLATSANGSCESLVTTLTSGVEFLHVLSTVCATQNTTQRVLLTSYEVESASGNLTHNHTVLVCMECRHNRIKYEPSSNILYIVGANTSVVHMFNVTVAGYSRLVSYTVPRSKRGVQANMLIPSVSTVSVVDMCIAKQFAFVSLQQTQLGTDYRLRVFHTMVVLLRRPDNGALQYHSAIDGQFRLGDLVCDNGGSFVVGADPFGVRAFAQVPNPPKLLSYVYEGDPQRASQTVIAYTPGSPSKTLVPHYMNGRPSWYTMSPSPPAGITFDSSSGRLTVGATSIQPMYGSFAILASNMGGTSIAYVVIDVHGRTNVTACQYVTSNISYALNDVVSVDSPIAFSGNVTVPRGQLVFELTHDGLPAGFSLDANTGTISGYALQTQSARVARVRCRLRGAHASAIANVTIQVVHRTTTYISYPESHVRVFVAEPIDSIIPVTNTPKMQSVFKLITSLPQGLALNMTTGTIVGTPTQLTSDHLVIVTAFTKFGTAHNMSTVISVTDTPPNVIYMQHVDVVCAVFYPCDVQLVDATDHNSGNHSVSSWNVTIVPQLPDGLGVRHSEVWHQCKTGSTRCGRMEISGNIMAAFGRQRFVVHVSTSGGSKSVAFFLTGRMSYAPRFSYHQPVVEYTLNEQIVPNVVRTSAEPVCSVTGGATPFQWVDPIANNHMDIGLHADDGATSVSLDFSVSFECVMYHKSTHYLWVSSNGLLCFGGNTNGTYNGYDFVTSLPPHNCVMVLASDLTTLHPNSTIYKGVDGVAPNRALTLTWYRVSRKVDFVNTTWPIVKPVTFQARLYENSSQIQLNYHTVHTVEGVLDQIGYNGPATNETNMTSPLFYILYYNRVSTPVNRRFALSTLSNRTSARIDFGSSEPSVFTVSPTLPNGLVLNTTSGAIGGVPLSPTTHPIPYVVSHGTQESIVSIHVRSATPTFSYANTMLTFVKGLDSSPITPTHSSNIVMWTISPPPPIGLSFSSLSGTLSGVALNAIESRRHVVSACTADHKCAKQIVEIRVNLAVPTWRYAVSSVTLQLHETFCVLPTVLLNNDTIHRWTVSPPLPEGLSLNVLTGEIRGSPVVAQPFVSYSIAAVTSDGGRSSKSLDVRIVSSSQSMVTTTSTRLYYTQSENILVVGKPIEPSTIGPISTLWHKFKIITNSVPLVSRNVNINAATGFFSGTPTASLPRTIVTIGADLEGENNGRNDSVTIAFTIKEGVAQQFVYPTSSIVFRVGTNMSSAVVPLLSGVPPSWYSVDPPLAAGVFIVNSTGAISGAPTSAHPQRAHLITGHSTDGGRVFAVVRITAVPPQPHNLTYPHKRMILNVSTYGNNISSGAPTLVTHAQTARFSIAPSLPNGWAIHPTTGVIAGVTFEPMSDTITYTITASTDGGSTSTTWTVETPLNLDQERILSLLPKRFVLTNDEVAQTLVEASLWVVFGLILVVFFGFIMKRWLHQGKVRRLNLQDGQFISRTYESANQLTSRFSVENMTTQSLKSSSLLPLNDVANSSSSQVKLSRRTRQR